MTVAAAELTTLALPPFASVDGLFLRIVRWLTPSTAMADLEREIAHEVLFALSRFAVPVLSAEPEQLYEATGAAIDDPEWLRANVALLEAFQFVDGPELSAALEEPLPDLHRAIRTLGPRLAEAERFHRALAQVGLQFAAQAPEIVTAAEPEGGASVADLIARPEVPAECQRAVFAATRAAVCFLTVIEMMRHDSVPAGDFGPTLAAVWAESAREALRFYAALPEVHVPVDVLPSDQRLDLEEVARRHDRLRARLAASHAAFVASGEESLALADACVDA